MTNITYYINNIGGVVIDWPGLMDVLLDAWLVCSLSPDCVCLFICKLVAAFSYIRRGVL